MIFTLPNFFTSINDNLRHFVIDFFFEFSQARLSEAEKAYDELSDKERMIMGKYFFTLNSSFD